MNEGPPGAWTETEARVENCVFEGRDVSLHRHTNHPSLLRTMAGHIIQERAGTRLHSSPRNRLLAADHIAREALDGKHRHVLCGWSH